MYNKTIRVKGENLQTNDIDAQLHGLIEKHQDLDDQADALSAQRFLTPIEQRHLKILKVQRLIARETLDNFRKQHDIIEKGIG